MIGISSLLLWASLSIGGSSAGCYTNLEITLNAEPSNEGWNGLGRGFLSMFTPAKLTDEHWEMMGKIYREKNFGLVKDFAFTMGGLVFLVVVSVLLILCFCAAPIALCVFSCTCKKKCKLGPKSQSNIIAYTGIGCNSMAMLTITLSILFCYLSISSLTDGIKYIETSVEPLPGTIEGAASTFQTQLKECGITKLVSSLSKPVDELPSKVSTKVVEIPAIKDVMAIDFDAKTKSIEGFGADIDNVGDKIKAAKAKLESFPAIAPLLAPVFVKFDDAQASLNDIKQKLGTSGGDGSIKNKLEDVAKKRDKASKTEIESKVKEQTQASADKIKKVGTDANKKIDNAFKGIKTIKGKVSNVTGKIISFVEKAKDYLGYMQAVNLLLFPCYLALASAIWSTCKVTKLMKKKKAKRREKTGLLIPLAIGLCLAFLPLLVSTSFMASAGVSNVACSTVFYDSSFGFLPKALNTFDVPHVQNLSGIELDIPKFIGECRSKNLVEAFNLDSKLDKNMVAKQFNLAEKKQDMSNKLMEMSFGLPAATEWSGIEAEIDDIEPKKVDANTRIADLQILEITGLGALISGDPTDSDNKIGRLSEVQEIKTASDALFAKVDPFVNKCKEDITIAKTLNEADIKKEMVVIMVGDATATPPTRGLMDDLLTTIDGEYQTFRTSLIADSPSCGFIFPLIDSFGRVFCDQALGGLNGVYAAIGLAVMSFFSAAVGTVLIWHSFRAGRGPQEDKTGGSDSKKNKKKGKKGAEEESPPDMAGKVGEQATPIPPKSEPTPPEPIIVTISHPDGVVQAVPTDPAALGDKTNPSLLPNDALPADPAAAAAGGVQPESGGPTPGTPLSPNPIQMINMETNPTPDANNEPKSSTGAGAGETGGATKTQ